MKALGNIIGKGAKVAAHVLAGSVLYGLGAAAANFHPAGVAGVLWTMGGSSAVAGLLAAAGRAINFDPSKAWPAP